MCALPWVSQLGNPVASTGPGAGASPFVCLARGSYTLINGTGGFTPQIPIPADGNPHTVMVSFRLNVTSGETGGALQCVVADQGSATTSNQQLSAGGVSASVVYNNLTIGVLGSVVSPVFPPYVQLSQSSALTAGAASVTYEVWVS